MATKSQGGLDASDPFSFDSTIDVQRTIEKEDRKASELTDMAAAREARAAAWSREEAQRIAAQDLELLKDSQTVSPSEAHYQRQDMERNASASPSYKAELYALDPVVAQELDKAKEQGHSPALVELGREFADRQVNSVAPFVGREAQHLEGAAETQRSAWLNKGKAAEPMPPSQPVASSGNKVESDEIFTASQIEVQQVVPDEVAKRYTKSGNRFYDAADPSQPDFLDKGNRLETGSNGERAAESMVRIAEARGWDEIKVEGSENFRREAWREAAERGMQVKGYTPNEKDMAELAKRSPSAAIRSEKAAEVEPQKALETGNQRMARSFANDATQDAVRKHPELAGAAAAAVAMDQRAQADGLNPSQRAIVAARVRENITNSIERGNTPSVTVREEVEQRVKVHSEREATR